MQDYILKHAMEYKPVLHSPFLCILEDFKCLSKSKQQVCVRRI